MSYLYQKSTSQNQVGQFFSTLSNGYANMYISSEKNVEFKNQSLKVQKFHQELSGAKRGSHPIDRLSHAFSFFVIKLPFRCTTKCKTKCKPKLWYCGTRFGTVVQKVGYKIRIEFLHFSIQTKHSDVPQKCVTVSQGLVVWYKKCVQDQDLNRNQYYIFSYKPNYLFYLSLLEITTKKERNWCAIILGGTL